MTHVFQYHGSCNTGLKIFTAILYNSLTQSIQLKNTKTRQKGLTTSSCNLVKVIPLNMQYLRAEMHGHCS